MKRMITVFALVAVFSLVGVGCKKGNNPGQKKSMMKDGAKTYAFNPAATRIGWTAFKFTKKTGVNGHFAKVTATGVTKGKSAHEILKGIRLQIDTTSVKTGNPARDISIATNFFKKFMGGPMIEAQVTRIEGKEKGKLHLQFKLHKMTKMVVFDYTLSAAGKLEAKATIDMLKIGLKAPFESIQKSCEVLHKGKDGKSKTWSDVVLSVTSQLTVK